MSVAVRMVKNLKDEQNKIGVLGEMAETMSDKDHRLPCAHTTQRLEELVLARGVHCGGGLVDDDKLHLVGHEPPERA